MASVSKDHGGTYRVLVSHGGKRHAIRLGKTTKAIANTVADRLESLRTARRYGMPIDAAVAAWVGSLGDDLHERVAATGLIPSRRSVNCRQFLDRFSTGEKSPLTLRNDRQAITAALEFLPHDKPISEVTPADAEALRQYMADVRGFARATWSRHMKRIRSWFAAAKRDHLITENPFSAIRLPAVDNPERKRFIDRETFQRVIDQTDNPQWRLVLCLARYGGLRVPSEALDLRWSDIDWKGKTIRIRAHKTKERTIPLFSELRPYLEAMPRTGSDHVITQARRAFPQWRRVVIDLVAKAGVKLWPRVFHNLRASRETELAQTYSLATTCEWIGNSQAVAMSHYLTVHPEDFARAVA